MKSVEEWGSQLQDDVIQALDKLREVTKNINIADIKVGNANDLYKVLSVYGTLSRALTESSRENRERTALLQEVASTMKIEIRNLMQLRPDLVAECQAVINEAAERELLKLESKGEQIDNFNPNDMQSAGRHKAPLKNVRPRTPRQIAK